MPEPPELALLKRFRYELHATMLQIEVLSATRNSLMSVVAGLEDLCVSKGIPVRGKRGPTQLPLLESPPIVAAVLSVLRDQDAPISAKTIHDTLRQRGFVIKYSTLYKAIQRESRRGSESTIRRRGAKYELTEIANSGTGTER